MTTETFPDASPDVPAFETLVIRRWEEPGHPRGFRARLTYGQASGGGPRTVATSDPAAVLRAVQLWLCAQAEAGGKK